MSRQAGSIVRGNLKAAPDIRPSGPAAGGGYVLPVGQKVKVGRELARIGANAHAADRLSRNSNARPGQTALLIPGPCCRSDITFGPRRGSSCFDTMHAAAAVRISLTLWEQDFNLAGTCTRHRRRNPCKIWTRRFANVPTTSGSPMVSPTARPTSIG